MSSDRPQIRVVPPLALLIGILASIGLEWALPLGLFPAFPWAPGLFLRGPVILLAIAVNVAGARAFLAAGTPINPYNTSTTVVRGGAYRFTRNPMYLGMILFLAGLGPALSLDWAISAAGVLWAVLHWGVVLHEEAYLKEKFGEDYKALLAETRRWL